MAFVSAGMTFRGSAGVGWGVEPSKNPQRRFACIASWKRTAKIAQFVPSGLRCGILAGSCSIAGVGAGGGGGAEVVDVPAGGAAGADDPVGGGLDPEGGAAGGTVDMMGKTAAVGTSWFSDAQQGP